MWRADMLEQTPCNAANWKKITFANLADNSSQTPLMLEEEKQQPQRVIWYVYCIYLTATFTTY